MLGYCNDMDRNAYACPVCGYFDFELPPSRHDICSCCGTEFGFSDDDTTHEELRAQWIAGGAKWWFREPPEDWSPEKQLKQFD